MNILVVNDVFFLLSETFVYDHLRKLDTENVYLLAYEQKNRELFGLNYPLLLINRFNEGFIDKCISKARRILGIDLDGDYSFFATKKIEKYILENKIELIHCHFGTNATRILPIAQRLNIPIVTTFHGYDASTMLANKNYTSRLRKLFAYSSRNIVVASFMIEKLAPFGLNKKMVTVLPCGVDDTKFFSSNKVKNNSLIKLLHVGRLVEKKGVIDLVKVVVEILIQRPELSFSLDVIGDGPEFSEIETIIANSGCQRSIRLLGALSHEAVKQFISGCDVLILNSRLTEKGDSEGTPVVILEAMASGKAVVSTFHAGIPDVITNKIEGLLVPEKDNQALRQAIELLVSDSELRHKLGIAAVARIKEKYTLDGMISKIRSIYSQSL